MTATSSPARSMRRRRPDAWPSSASSGTPRGSWPGSRSSSTTSVWPTTWPKRASDTQAAATLADVGEAAGRLGRELVLGRHTVDELVAVTGWPVASVLAGLTLLERRGLAVGVHGRFRPAGTLAGMDPAIARQRPRQRRKIRPRTRRDRTPWLVATSVTASRFARTVRTGATLPRGRSPPERAQDPALGGSPDHEQECLLRQAAIALLAVPVSRAARVSAVLRRSTLARVSLALGLSFVLGVGVLGCRSAGDSHRDPPERRSARSSQSAFATTFSTDRDLSEAVTIAFATPMDRASVAAALKVQPAKPSTSRGTAPARS